jgi:hypothetical protein
VCVCRGKVGWPARRGSMAGVLAHYGAVRFPHQQYRKVCFSGADSAVTRFTRLTLNRVLRRAAGDPGGPVSSALGRVVFGVVAVLMDLFAIYVWRLAIRLLMRPGRSREAGRCRLGVRRASQGRGRWGCRVGLDSRHPGAFVSAPPRMLQRTSFGEILERRRGGGYPRSALRSLPAAMVKAVELCRNRQYL